MGSGGASDAESEGGRMKRSISRNRRSSRHGYSSCGSPPPVGAGIKKGTRDERQITAHLLYLLYTLMASREGLG
jgi:hypothetical protein